MLRGLVKVNYIQLNAPGGEHPMIIIVTTGDDNRVDSCIRTRNGLYRLHFTLSTRSFSTMAHAAYSLEEELVEQNFGDKQLEPPKKKYNTLAVNNQHTLTSYIFFFNRHPRAIVYLFSLIALYVRTCLKRNY